MNFGKISPAIRRDRSLFWDSGYLQPGVYERNTELEPKKICPSMGCKAG